MKKIMTLLLLVFAFSFTINAQTITKTASKSAVYIGEEFYYTFKVEGFNNLSDLDKIVDKFGPEIDIVSVDLSQMSLFQSPLFCNNLSYTTTNNIFTLDFDRCNGVAIGNMSSFTFRIKVKLNKRACNNTQYDNIATLYLHNTATTSVDSNRETVLIKQGHPYQLQKTFRSYSVANQELTYDVRLSSSTGDFNLIDFLQNAGFEDSFTVPSCYTISPSSVANTRVEYLQNVQNSTPIVVASNATASRNVININWQLPANQSYSTSILFQVKIKVDSCTCVNSLFKLSNAVTFNAKDLCGNDIKLGATSDIANTSCNPPTNGNPVGSPNIPAPIVDSLRVTKSVQLKGNDLNLTMKGCAGTYTITIENTSGRLNYNNFNLSDVIPAELSLNGGISISGNANHTLSGNSLTVNSTGTMRPNDVVTIEIPFEVTTAIPNLSITNCVNVTANGFSNGNPFTVNRNNVCAPTIRTVPNTVAIHTTKSICESPSRTCGPMSINTNLPEDEVEYTLHFYNYGTVEATDITVVDQLPQHFTVQDINRDIKIYRKYSGQVEDVCGDMSDFKDITQSVRTGYDRTLNRLELGFDPSLKLNEFTCEGVVNYVVKIKTKIDTNTPNGRYDNQFFVYYKDPSLGISDVVASNKVSSIVNVDNLVIGDKSVKSDYKDCPNKRRIVTYQIVLANFGSMPVLTDIEDRLNIPTPVSVTSRGIHNFKMCKFSGLNNQCSPSSVPSLPTTLTNTTFKINAFELQPCEVAIIEYTVEFDINRISRGEQLEVCNDARVRTYMPSSRMSVPVFTSNSDLINNYMQAKSIEEQLEVLALIKAVKQNPEILNNQSKDKHTRVSKSSQRNINFDFGTESLAPNCRAKVTLTDCLKGAASGCLTRKTTPFNFSITGMNAQGEITTSLSNLPPNKKVTKIEYLLTDVRVVKPCKPRRFWWGRRSWSRCIGSCSKYVVGNFTTTNTSPINSSLNFLRINTRTGTYNELNKVEFSGNPTIVTQDNRTFKFPVSVNCNGTYEFTITAIVHFEDCSVCYVTDVFDYNARWSPIIIHHGGGISLPPFIRI